MTLRRGLAVYAAAALATSAAPAAARPDPSTQNAGAATTTGTGAPTPPAANGGADGRLAVVSRIATGSGDGMGALFPLLIVLGAAAVGGGDAPAELEAGSDAPEPTAETDAKDE